MVSANYKHREIFKYKFKREPKQWSIEKLHELWLKTEERYEKRWRDVTNYLNYITSVLKPDEKGEYQLFFMQNDRYRYYRIKWNHQYRGYSFGIDDIKYETRDDKLFFLTKIDEDMEPVLKMGEHFGKLYKLTNSRLSGAVHKVLWDEIYDRLRNHYSSSLELPPKAFTVKISDKEYIIKCDNQSSYMRFEMLSQIKNNPILIK